MGLNICCLGTESVAAAARAVRVGARKVMGHLVYTIDRAHC